MVVGGIYCSTPRRAGVAISYTANVSAVFSFSITDPRFLCFRIGQRRELQESLPLYKPAAEQSYNIVCLLSLHHCVSFLFSC